MPDTQEWWPSNELERNLFVAITEGDSAEYGRLIAQSTLVIPELPFGGTSESERLRELFGPEIDFQLVFTSTEAMHQVLGTSVTSYRMLSFDDLVHWWTDPQRSMLLDPLLPIGTLLPIGSIAQLARGEDTLFTRDHLQDIAEDTVYAAVRETCLTGLGDGVDVLQDGVVAHEPVNDLEQQLTAALSTDDMAGFLLALAVADVFLPDPAQAPEPDADPRTGDLPAEGDQYLVLESGGVQAIPMFSSSAALSRVSRIGMTWIVRPFAEVADCWPSEDHVMCLNPGMDTELILTGEALYEIIADLVEALAEE